MDEDYEPVLDEAFEFESAMASAGWGTDEDYGYYGDNEDFGFFGDEAFCGE